MLIKTKNVHINIIEGIAEDGHHYFTQEFKYMDLPEVNFVKLGRVLEELRHLAELIDKELTASHSADTLDDIMSNIEIRKEDDGELQIVIIDPTTPGGMLAKRCLTLLGKKKRAKQAYKKQQAKQREVINKISYNKSSEVNVTTTKLQKEFYSLTTPRDIINGQVFMNLDYGSDGKVIPLPTVYYFNEALEEKDRIFTAYDFFVGVICNNLFIEGNTKVTPSKILHEMGDDTGATANINKLMKSLIKGMLTVIEVDNRTVLEAWGKNTKKYKRIKTPVIPCQIEEEVSAVRGNISETTIYINGLSPFYLVGEPLNQLTKWDKRLFQLYDGSKTERYWRVMQYLMIEIAYAENNTSRHKTFTWESIYKFCGDTSREMKRKTKDMTWKVIKDVFEPLDYIHDAIEDNITGDIKFKIHKNRKPDEDKINKILDNKNGKTAKRIAKK